VKTGEDQRVVLEIECPVNKEMLEEKKGKANKQPSRRKTDICIEYSPFSSAFNEPY